MNTLMGHRWYVVRTQPHSENKASAHLGRQGFETYLPRYLKKRRHARRVETVQAALFPCYLFVAIDRQTQRWRCISSTIGVSHLVCNGEEPALVPDSVIGALRDREDESGLDSSSHTPSLCDRATRFVSLTAPLSTALGCSRV